MSACEETIVDASSVDLESLKVKIEGVRGGAKMRIIGYEMNFTESRLQSSLQRLKNGKLLYMEVKVSGDQGFVEGQIYAAHGTKVQVQCDGSWSCAWSEFLVSNAQSLQVQCTSANDENNSTTSHALQSQKSHCLERAVVYCPVSAALDRRPEQCIVDCGHGQHNCKAMKLFHIGGVDGMHLNCKSTLHSSLCEEMHVYCGLGLERHCIMDKTLSNEFASNECSICSYMADLPIQVSSGNYWIADYPYKYRNKVISCDPILGGDSCVIVSGTLSYVKMSRADAERSIIVPNDISKVWIYGHSEYSFAHSIINPDLTSNTSELHLFSVHKHSIFQSAQIFVPLQLLELQCHTLASCSNSVVFTSRRHLQTWPHVHIACTAPSSCSNSLWHLHYTPQLHTNITCFQSHNACKHTILHVDTAAYTSSLAAVSYIPSYSQSDKVTDKATDDKITDDKATDDKVTI
ncbi:hypothetical protein RFI_22478 [Reticulomyxa filosa]|uniref:Uncharacterized protein n=1 Tax=Reticulomyxa filosa TaxID=46433 RepID=X6MM41_RETFI|nr:hypothetical protein RFI_22478 [Reticulomyxa filosa]|eukprot:ETO14889.1 hypothetical protein RFI_22478 [Reticulomyxa filosa]